MDSYVKSSLSLDLVRLLDNRLVMQSSTNVASINYDLLIKGDLTINPQKKMFGNLTAFPPRHKINISEECQSSK